jgi:hypothetical protein
MAGPVFVLQIVLLRWGRKHLLPRAVGCGSHPRTAVAVAGGRSHRATRRLPQGRSERGADPRHRLRHPAGQSPPASQRQAEPVRRRQYKQRSPPNRPARQRPRSQSLGRSLSVVSRTPLRTVRGWSDDGRSGGVSLLGELPIAVQAKAAQGAGAGAHPRRDQALITTESVPHLSACNTSKTPGGRITLSTVERRLAELRSHPPGHCPLCPGARLANFGRGKAATVAASAVAAARHCRVISPTLGRKLA